jgi:hypothetical protein
MTRRNQTSGPAGLPIGDSAIGCVGGGGSAHTSMSYTSRANRPNRRDVQEARMEGARMNGARTNSSRQGAPGAPAIDGTGISQYAKRT